MNVIVICNILHFESTLANTGLDRLGVCRLLGETAGTARIQTDRHLPVRSAWPSDTPAMKSPTRADPERSSCKEGFDSVGGLWLNQPQRYEPTGGKTQTQQIETFLRILSAFHSIAYWSGLMVW